MAAVPTTTPTTAPLRSGRRRIGDRVGDGALRTITALAALAVVVLLGAIVYKILHLAHSAWSTYGLHFVTAKTWDPVHKAFGALPFIYGTAISSLIALLISAPLAIGIALYLTELAPKGVRGVVGSLIEMLAAIPSVVLGLWGILVLGPFLANHLEPWLHRKLGFIGIFGAPEATGTGLFTAGLILTIMVVPIVASICRELFMQVPADLEEGALALGTTRWEMIRGVTLPATRSGIAAALILGLGRALGEAIAVTQVIGGGTRITNNVFGPGDTLASKIAASYQGAASSLEQSSLLYLGALLLIIGLVVNLVAQVIVRRFDPLREAR
ncbi:MAG: phosphate ABC transporter permease subunit PstC [Actinobacteria bacterium]|nr:MAG: phosphate ABC transporter permease subunit PstC [Actinomycetota bacterium]